MDIKKKILPLLIAAVAFAACNKNNDAETEQAAEQPVSVSDTGYTADSITPNDEIDKTPVTEDDVIYSADGKILISFPADRTGIFTVPDGTEIIGERAFFQSGITSIILPSSLRSIEKSAFLKSSLIDITIPPGVTDIGDYAFMSSALKSITLNEGLKNMGTMVLANTAVTKISLPDSIESCGLIFGDDMGKKIYAPLSAMYSEGMSQLYSQENVSCRGETDFDILLRRTGELDYKRYNGRIFIDIDGDNFPEMAEVNKYGWVSWYEFDTENIRWYYIIDTPADTDLHIYYDSGNDICLFIFPARQDADEYYDLGYREGKFLVGGYSPDFYNEVISGSNERYRYLNTVNVQSIIDEYGDNDKMYEIVMSDLTGTSSWRGVSVTEFPCSVKWFPDSLEIKADGRDVLNGEAAEGITYKDRTLFLDGLNIDGDIYISGLDKLDIFLSGDNDISDLKFMGTSLTIKGDGTLSAENILPKDYHRSHVPKWITICENARIIGKDEPEKSTSLNRTVRFTDITVKDNGYLETPSISGDCLTLSGNACVKTIHCEKFDDITLTGSSVMEVVSDYKKYPALKITYELHHSMYGTPQISVSGSSRLSVVCGTSFGIDCYGRTDSKVTVSDNGILEISGTSSYGLTLGTGIPGALTMNGNALVSISGSDHALTAHKIEISGGTLDIRSNEIAAYINFAASSETGLFINGDVVSQSSDWVLSQFEPGITYKLAVSSAETEEILKDFSITVKEKK